ncbi:MAG TPA: hypothetical protein VKB80_10930 [Kofleriaceae bacterium]|nr:hypothetical protein [Kofleriaceae bacterium]
MTHKRKALTRLRDARTRLRDLEAARTAQAAARCEEERRGLAAAGHDLASAVQHACEQMAAARAVAELESAGDQVNAARGAVVDARQAVDAAAESQRAAAQLLSRRERDLRSTERALDVVSSAERRAGDRREQVQIDDLVGARAARRDP